jgi:phospholipase C
LYQNGIKPRQFKNFADDVVNNTLPQVSWLIAPYYQSEHPAFLPARGSQYIYTVLETLASNPEVWSKTVLFLTFDENDGYFDHVAPPTAPPGTPGEYITAPLPKAAGGIAGPIGPGFRVPTVVISPWSQGGWVCSEVFDHTSLLRFAEARFGVKEPNISAWRRKTCGDLTSTLRFDDKRRAFPIPRSPADKVAQEMQACATKPKPQVPQEQTLPHQERGDLAKRFVVR